MEINFFEIVTGECLLGCEGDSASGHKRGCPALDIAAEVKRLQAIETAAREYLNSASRINIHKRRAALADALDHKPAQPRDAGTG